MNQEFAVFANGVDQERVLSHLVSQLRQLKGQLTQNKEGTITQKSAQLPRSLAAVFSYLEQRGLEPSGDNAQQRYIDQVITYLKSLPIVTLKLAFEPGESFIKSIAQVLNGQIGQKVILDIIVDPKIVAGVVIEHKGRFADYSYQGKTDEYLQQRLTSFFTKDQSEDNR